MKHLFFNCRLLCSLLLSMFLFLGEFALAGSYKITFNVGSNDGSSVTTSTSCSSIVSEGSSYLYGNLATATNVYNAGSDGLKLGTSGSSGKIKMNLSDAGKVNATTVVVRAKRYNSGKATKIVLNGKTAQDLTASFADYTFTINNDITYLELVSSKGTSGGAYCWIESIIVNYSTPSSDPYTVTFNVGDHGKFAKGETFDAGTTKNRTEASAGAGVTLPDVDANDGFKFLGWTATEGKTTIDAGLTAGATYKPFENIELYAVYGEHYQVTIIDPENGTLSVKCGGKDVTSGEYYAVGEVINIVASPATGYKFRNIQVVDASTHTFTASNIRDWTMGAHEITIKANFDEIVYRTITWSVNGNTSVIEPSKVEDGTNITFPIGLEDILGKKFMGWSANSAANAESDLVSGDIAASESTTLFYAVFADVTPGAQETATLTCTATTENTSYTTFDATDDQGNTWSMYANTQKKTDQNNEIYYGLTTNTKGYHVSSPTFSGNVVSIKMKTYNGGSSARSFYFCSSTGTKQPTSGDIANLTVGSGQKGKEQSVDLSNAGEFKQFNIYANDALAFKWIEVTYGSPDVYSNYTTTLSGTIDFRASDESGAYWATYSGAYNVVIPAEDENAVYNVYAVAYESDALVMFDFVSDFNNVDAQTNPIVPANVGVLVKAVAKPEKTVSALTYTYSAAAGENYVAEYNSLHPASEDKEGLKNHKFYMLARDANGENIGFYYGAADGGVFTSRKGSAYLAVPTSASTPAPARFIFGQRGVPTDMLNVNDNNQSTKVLRDGRLYIVREGKTYDSFGRMVK